MEKNITKKDTDCQTVLQCSPHILHENETAIVRSEGTCQTEITSDPYQSNTELLNALKFVEPEEIQSNAVREIELPKRTRLHFKLPGNKSNTGFDEEIVESCSSTSTLVATERFSGTAIEQPNESLQFRSSHSSPNNVRSSGTELNPSSSKDLMSILKKRIDKGKFDNGIDTEVQTNLMVSPHMLGENKHAIVSSNLSAQTSVTCLPNDSISNILPKLTTYLDHEGTTNSLKTKTKRSASASVLDFINNLIFQVESKYERLSQFQMETSTLLPDIPEEPVDLTKSNSLVYENEECIKENTSVCEVEIEEQDPNCACEENETQKRKIKSVSDEESFIRKIINDIVNNITDEEISEEEITSINLQERTNSVVKIQNLLTNIVNSATKFKNIESKDDKSIKTDMRKSSVTAVQNILGNIINSATGFKENERKDEKPLANILSNYPCKVPNIKINIVMNNNSQTKLNIHASASIHFEDTVRNDKSLSVYPPYINQLIEMGMSSKCDCSEIQNLNETDPNVHPRVSVNVINKQEETDEIYLCACKRDKNIAVGVINKQEQTDINVCACRRNKSNEVKNHFENTKNNVNNQGSLKTADKCTRTDISFKSVHFEPEITTKTMNNVSYKCCKENSKSEENKKLEQVIKPEENFIVTCKCRKVTSQITSTISNSKCLSNTNSKIKSQRTTSVVGDEQVKNTSKLCPCDGHPSVPVISNDAYALTCNICKNMASKKNEFSQSIPESSKPIKKITIGIGPVEPDQNNPGSVNIPFKVTLSRKSESDTVVNALSSRHANFVSDENVEDSPQNTTDSAPQSEQIHACNRSGTSATCVPTCIQGYKTNTLIPLDTNISQHDEAEKCTKNTCYYYNKGKGDFILPWNTMEITEEVNLPLLEEEMQVDFEVGQEESEENTCCYKLCKKKKKKTKPDDKVEPPPLPPPEPEKPRLNLLVDQDPCYLNEPYTSALLHECESDVSLGVTWEEVITPDNINIKEGAIIVESDESILTTPGISYLEPYSYPSKPQLPQRVHKKINLRESVRFVEHEEIVEKRTMQSLLLKDQKAAPSTSIFTLYKSSSTFRPVYNKFSTFITAVDLTEEEEEEEEEKQHSVPLKSSLSKGASSQPTKLTRFADEYSNLTYQDESKLYIDETDSNCLQLEEQVASLTVVKAVASVTSTKLPAICVTSDTSDEFMFEHTITLTDKYEIISQEAEETHKPCNVKIPPGSKTRAATDSNVEICKPCNMKIPPDSKTSTGTVSKVEVCKLCNMEIPPGPKTTATGDSNVEVCGVCNMQMYTKEEHKCCSSEKLPTKVVREEPEKLDVCEPCKMTDCSKSSTNNVRCDPVTLALVACDKELKPVRQALNQVRLKLRNMNMPELGYLFKNETDINRHPRIENRSVYSSTYTSSDYNPPSYYRQSYTPNYNVSRSVSSENDQCNCCCCQRYNEETAQPESRNPNLRFRMRIKPDVYNTLNTAKRSKVKFESDDVPCKYKPSVSTMHRNPNIFKYESHENNVVPCCRNTSDSDTDTEGYVSSKFSRKQPKKEKRSKYGKRMTSHSSVCGTSCPYLEALRAVLSVENNNKKQPRKITKRSTGNKVHLRFKIKSKDITFLK